MSCARRVAAQAALTLLLAVVIAACGGVGAHANPVTGTATVSPSADPTGGVPVTVGASPVSQTVPSGFLGLSMEFRGFATLAGRNPSGLDAAFEQLVRNLAPGGSPVIRIGGDSTDSTWWPVPGMARPGGASLALTPAWAAVAKTFARAVHGKLMLGINFEANNRRVAAYEEQQLARYVGMSSIEAFELGNEPELYSVFAWYKTATGKRVLGRAASYNQLAFISNWSAIARGLGNEPLAGPESSSPNWLNLSQFLADDPRVSIATVHTYPLKHCSANAHPTEAELFTPSSLQVLANEVAGWRQEAAARRLPLRVDEMNSVTCGGYLPVSGSFGPALWALNVLPLYLRAGVVGVNFHTVPSDWQSLIDAFRTRGGWQIKVQPEYYGLLTFAELAPTGSQLLQVFAPPHPGLFEWAVRTPSHLLHVVLTNVTKAKQVVAVRIPSESGSATEMLLRGPSLTAAKGVTLGGQVLSGSTGELTGTPASMTIAPAGHVYEVQVPPTSAAILTL